MKFTKKWHYALLVLVVFYCFINNRLIVKYTHFQGTLTRVFVNHYDHGSLYCSYELNNQVFDEQISSDKLFDTAQAGDYIIKRSGELYYILIKNKKDTLIFTDIK